MAWLCTETLAAQETYRVIRTENFRREPSGQATLLATVNAGVEMISDSAGGRWVRVALEGWVWARSVDSTARLGFDLTVTPRNGENLRSEPNGAIRARLSSGTLLEELERRTGWVRVRRVGWMFGQSLEREGGTNRVAGAAGAAAEPDVDETVADSGGPYLDRGVTASRTTLRRTPDGEEAGTLEPDTPVRVLARSGEWVRVQTEGWIRDSDLGSAAPGVLVGVSGAEVRANPGEFEGRLVQWVVQFVAIQSADEVRRDIPVGRPYMLARGPLPESGFLYALLTDYQVEQLERVPPLGELVIIGRIRTARSHYLGNPVLDLIELAPRPQ
jgi:hypothetical protein